MSTTTPGGGRAFPALHQIDGNWIKEPLAEHRGMTLRDYFAAAALQGLLACSRTVRLTDENAGMSTERDGYSCCAYALADAMIAARERKDA